MKKRIAIVGAGIAGLAVARTVQDFADVAVFEKSRGLGGRMAQRRREDYAFDHGAQYFSVRGRDFAKVINDAEKAGAVARWPSSISTFPARDFAMAQSSAGQDRYTGVPGMSSLAAYLATGLEIRREFEVSTLERGEAGWQLRPLNKEKTGVVIGPFDFVVCATPAPQVLRLMPTDFSGQETLESVRMSGCFTLMIGDVERRRLPFQAARIDHPILSWVAANDTKPGRTSTLSLTVHSRNDWAEAHLEADRDWIRQTMLAALSEVLGMDFSDAAWIDLHRWRYANVENAAGKDYLWDEKLNLAACGDWCLGNRVEAAFDSGRQLGAAIRRWAERE
ncbi:FAD-dependent oxidoreductase [Peteryoungia desertarenae]|uniref:FAD-dependent oxidoreductase n=1 Tax=Peteryoungia desertarenae TaxID=1813451 RepID=A0ABX6QIZ6_9HYPH|nr:FAD-dependent oxidoreductase [Peteryoungia desertarenae]QLF68427.1 FAD-dependent oxidoreductase [Peteryoungia desertarenae]